VIDGFLLGAFMLIFGFGIYELFLADLQAARSSEASGRILRINSLDDLKTRLAKVILIILIVETFKDAFGVKAQTPLDLLVSVPPTPSGGGAQFLVKWVDETAKRSWPSSKTDPPIGDRPLPLGTDPSN
jgi:Uncharacterized protein family, UPF0114